MHILFEIETRRLHLRKLLSEDEDDIFEILSDEQTCLDGGGFHAFPAKDSTYSACFTQMCKRTRYAVILKQEEKCIGLINLQDLERTVPTCKLGFVMNPGYRRQGYMYEAVSSLISEWFHKTDVQMFTASHFPHNKESENLILKLGFAYEGTEHKAMTHALYGAIDLVCYNRGRK